MITDLDIDKDFWECYPEFKVLAPFKAFYKGDRSKNKNQSSKIMWAIALAESHHSNWYNLGDKYDRLRTDFLGDKNFKWDAYEALIDAFKDTQLTQAEKSLTAWNEQMMKRDRYLKNQEYYFDQYALDENGDNRYSKTGQPVLVRGTAEQLDKAYSATPKMYADYDKIKKAIDEERSVVNNIDGKSLSDMGVI